MKEFKPGINHIEYWISDSNVSLPFFEGLFSIIGWKKLNSYSFSTGHLEIYFLQREETFMNTVGPRHICFQATSKEVVDKVYEYLKVNNIKIIRGPIEMNHYSEGYYTVDFYDPDGYILEVAYTPNMEL